MSTANPQQPRTGLEERLQAVVMHATRGKPDWKLIEAETGVPAEKWRNFNRGAIKAAPEMVEAVGRKWPDFAFWLVTGLTEPESGHVAPPSHTPKFPIWRGTAQQWATEERAFLLELIKEQEQQDSDPAKLHAEIEKARKSKRLPAYYNNFKQICEAYHESERPEMFLLEIHPTLQQIRRDRYRAESDLRQQVYTLRHHAQITDPFESTAAAAIDAFSKWAKPFRVLGRLFR